MKFTIEVEMPDRWVSHFMGMLQTMQVFGSMGCSRVVGLYADGDGDFHPKFKFDGVGMPDAASPIYNDGDRFDGDKEKCDVLYDAG